jgi:SAC3 family protein LENG8/THP3
VTNSEYRYKPDIKIRFLTEELGFESDQDCVQFLCDRNAQDLLQEVDGVAKLLTGKVGALFESAKTDAFRKVDIKGQI